MCADFGLMLMQLHKCINILLKSSSQFCKKRFDSLYNLQQHHMCELNELWHTILKKTENSAFYKKVNKWKKNMHICFKMVHVSFKIVEKKKQVYVSWISASEQNHHLENKTL